MPIVAATAVPNVAIVCSSDDVVAATAPVNVDVPIDVNVPVDVDVPIDVNVPVDVNIPVDVDVLIDLRSVCRCCDSEPKRGKDRKNDRNFP